MRSLLYTAALLGGFYGSAAPLLAAQSSSQLSSYNGNSAVARFVQTALADNPRVLAARYAVDASEASHNAAGRPLYNPALGLEIENGVDQTRALQFSQTLDWGDKRGARAAAAHAARQSAEAAYLAVRQELSLELLAGLASFQTGQERQDLATEQLGLMDDFKALARRRFGAGDIPQVELNLASLALSEAYMQGTNASAAVAEAEQQVLGIVGISAQLNWPTLDSSLPALPNNNRWQALVLSLPQVELAQRALDAARASVELRSREQRPDPTFSLSAGQQNNEPLVGINLSIPLPLRNNYSDEVEVARAEQRQSQQQLDDVLRRANARLRSAAQHYQLTQTAWQQWQQSGQPGLQQHRQQLRQLWQSGELSSTEYLVQIKQTLDTRDSALDLLQARWLAWFEWLAASGQVNQWLNINRPANI